MTHDPSTPVQEAPALWVITCSCGKRLEGAHPNTVTARHGHHVEIAQARVALEDGIARREETET